MPGEIPDTDQSAADQARKPWPRWKRFGALAAALIVVSGGVLVATGWPSGSATSPADGPPNYVDESASAGIDHA